ncbi:MAG: MASE1 domain-containing protein [Thermoplasmatota archaeon]|nr:MASE1 domain-containing protein [Halobacteriales archaeon]
MAEEQRPKQPDLGMDVLTFLAVVAAYAITGRVSLELFHFLDPSSSPVWPPTGIAIAALLLGGLRLAPAVYIGALIVNVTNPLGPGVPASLLIAGGNTMEAVVAAVLIGRFSGGKQTFQNARGVFLFTLLTADAALVSAVVGVATLLWLTPLGLPEAPGVLATWWLGDAVGAILVAPVVLLWGLDRSPGVLQRRLSEAALLGAGIVFLGVTMGFVAAFEPSLQGTQLRFLALPLILWAAFRFGMRETATCAGLLAVVALTVYVVQAEAGSPEYTLLFLQAFLGVSALTGLAVAALVGERRTAIGSLGVARDELELRVAVRTAALETALDDLARSNKDLQEFAYVASHDLQEPLRAVAGYTQLLQRRHAAALNDDAKGLIDKAVDGAVRMQSLINDLLSFSRVGTHGQPLRPLPLDEPLQVALRNLETPLRETGAALQQSPLPRVIADEGQMVQLLQNLVGNAIKFHQPGVPPQVQIGAEAGANGMTTLYVRDNGIGIEPRHYERVFVIFQRLHRAGEYPGSGIGLAVAKRIVERHGGRIWVESQPGRGTTFRFTLRSA